MLVKAKDAKNCSIWHYGILEASDRIRTGGQSVMIVPRTICRNTMVKCQGQFVYENDWIVIDECGEIHKFLVVCGEKEFRAYEDESASYDLIETAKYGKIVGNLYG